MPLGEKRQLNKIMADRHVTKACHSEEQRDVGIHLIRHAERSATGTERSNLFHFVRHCERSEAISWFLKIATDSKCHRPRNDEECLLHFDKIGKDAVRPRNDGKRKAVVVC